MAREPIGHILLKSGAASKEQLIAARQQQVLFGDRLGTNLLAEGLIDEKTLALALGAQHQVHAAWGALLHVDRRLIDVVKRSLAERYSVVPHHIDGRTLSLLMIDPNNVHAIDDVAATTKLSVTPVVVCEARMWQLLQEHYGISGSMRPISLEGDPFALPQRVPQTGSPTNEREQFDELTTPELFEELYAPSQPREPTLELPPQPTPASAPPVVVSDEVFLPGTPVARAAEAPELLLLEEEHEEEEQTPLTFDEAVALLEDVHDREEIARVVLRFALSRFRRACLLTVHSSGFVGWQAAGECDASALRRYRLAAKEQSVFQFVVDSRAHYLGPLQTYKAHGPWVKVLGKKIPLSVVVFPVLVRGRVVNLFYGDNGHGEHVPSEVGELLILAQRISRSYEALLDSARAPAEG